MLSTEEIVDIVTVRYKLADVEDGVDSLMRQLGGSL